MCATERMRHTGKQIAFGNRKKGGSDPDGGLCIPERNTFLESGPRSDSPNKNKLHVAGTGPVAQCGVICREQARTNFLRASQCSGLA
jgi:hypothetical protein